MKNFIIKFICYTLTLALSIVSLLFTIEIILPFCYELEKKVDNYWWFEMFEKQYLDYYEMLIFKNQQRFFAGCAFIIFFLNISVTILLKKFNVLKIFLSYLLFVIFVPLFYMSVMPTDAESLKTMNLKTSYMELQILNKFVYVMLILNAIIYIYLVLKNVKLVLNKYLNKEKTK